MTSDKSSVRLNDFIKQTLQIAGSTSVNNVVYSFGMTSSSDILKLKLRRLTMDFVDAVRLLDTTKILLISKDMEGLIFSQQSFGQLTSRQSNNLINKLHKIVDDYIKE